jgi:ssDNA-binding replication factor A large subunit
MPSTFLYVSALIYLEMKIEDLKDKTPVEDIVFTIGEVKEPSETRVGLVQQASIKDETGDATLTLWNEDCGKFKEGDKVKITKGWCKVYQGQTQVSSGKFGTIEKLTE